MHGKQAGGKGVKGKKVMKMGRRDRQERRERKTRQKTRVATRPNQTRPDPTRRGTRPHVPCCITSSGLAVTRNILHAHTHTHTFTPLVFPSCSII